MHRFLLFITLFIFAGIIGINTWIYFYDGDSTVRQQQADQLGHALLQQNSQLLIKHIQNNDLQSIRQVLDSLAQVEIVYSSALIYPNGQFRYQTERDQSVLTLTQLPNPPILYLEPLIANDNVIGFLKLALDTDQVTAHHNTFIEVIRNILLLIFVVTFLITSVLYSYVIQSSSSHVTKNTR